MQNRSTETKVPIYMRVADNPERLLGYATSDDGLAALLREAARILEENHAEPS